ncbi:MAG: dTMP kinase, partial [Candidatus Bathyarchaeia archaeon]
MQKPRRGVFIAVEGIDGSGKTTQSYLLVNQLRQLGYRTEYTAEPTYGPVGNIIRLHLSRGKSRRAEWEALLFAADRYHHIQETILPKLKRGITLVSDRYVYSSLAYQGAAGVDLEWIRRLNRFAPKPDLTLYLDVDPKASLGRKTEGRTVFEKLRDEEKTRRLYLRLAR